MTRSRDLVNPCGLSHGPAAPRWDSDNDNGVSTLYKGNGPPFPVGSQMVVIIPPPKGGTGPAALTGNIFTRAVLTITRSAAYREENS